MGVSDDTLKSIAKYGAIAVVLAAIVGGFTMSGVSTDDIPDRPEIPTSSPSDGADSIASGKSAELTLAAYDETASQATQVEADMQVWETSGSENFYLGSKTGSATDRTKFTNLVTGDDYKAVAFNDQYPYAKTVTGDVDSETVRRNLETFEAVSTSNLGTTVYDENGDELSTALSLGSEEQYQMQGFEVSVDNNNVAYNPSTVTIGYSENISDVEMQNAQEVETPESVKDDISGDDYVSFQPSSFSATEGAPALMGWETAQTGSIIVTADSDGTGSGDQLDIAVQDKALFINGAQDLTWGVEDDASSPNDVGVGVVTDSVNFN
jgi:hypothetical protein